MDLQCFTHITYAPSTLKSGNKYGQLVQKYNHPLHIKCNQCQGCPTTAIIIIPCKILK